MRLKLIAILRTIALMIWHVSIAFAVSAVCAVTAHATTQSLPLDVFTRHDEFGTIKISPDGEHIAVTGGKYGSSALVFIRLKDRKRIAGARLPEGFEIGQFHWVSNERVIYELAERQLGQVRPTLTGEIIAVDRDGKKQVLLYGYRAGDQQTGTRLGSKESTYATPSLISTLRNDDRHVLIAEYPWREIGNSFRYTPDAMPRIVLLDVYTGRRSIMGSAPLAGAEVLVDRQDQVRFAIGYDKQQHQAVIWKSTAEAKWEEFQLAGFREETVRPVAFTPDNRSVLFIGVRTGESVDSLNQMDLATRETRKLYGNEKFDIDGLVTDLTDDSVVGVKVLSEKPEFHWLADQATTRLYRSLQKAFPQQALEVISASQDGRKLIVFVYSDVNPGEYFLFDVPTFKADFLQAARQWVDPREMRPMQPVSIKARDGLPLAGYLTEPEGKGPHPLIVLPHGGPHGIRDAWGFDPEVQLLANRGYSVLQVNYRGSGGYGLDFQQAGYRQWGASMQDDVTDATRWAIDKGVTTKDQICIYGASYGGYAALMGAVRESSLYRCAVGYAGVYDLELMFNSGDIPDSRIGRNYLQNVLGSDKADLRARSPVNSAQAIQIPILLIHGKEDFRADYTQAVKMKATLEKNNKSLEWLALGGEGHGAYDEETRLQTYQKLLDFLGKHLSVKPGESSSQGSPAAN